MPEKPTRQRGGASMPCPQCDSNSRVLETRRGETTKAEILVWRDRECIKRGHRFHTIEMIDERA